MQWWRNSLFGFPDHLNRVVLKPHNHALDNHASRVWVPILMFGDDFIPSKQLYRVCQWPLSHRVAKYEDTRDVSGPKDSNVLSSTCIRNSCCLHLDWLCAGEKSPPLYLSQLALLQHHPTPADADVGCIKVKTCMYRFPSHWPLVILKMYPWTSQGDPQSLTEVSEWWVKAPRFV